jgi:hypothetical protein
MRRVGSSKDVNIVAQFDNEGDRGTNRYLIRPGGKEEQSESLGETDCGAPNVLSDFVSWAAGQYPAERYALILWSHGSAWEPSEIDRIARSVHSPDYSAREATDRSASPLGRTFFRSSMERIFSLPTVDERAICVDDGSGHSLDMLELGKVLEQAVQVLGQPIDLLGMDACLMSNLEVAYQARPYVRYIVASEESEPNDGWPYDMVLRKLVDQPEQPTASLAAHIVKSYVKSYVERGYTGAVTQSALDCSKIEPVSEALDELAEALLACMPEARTMLWMAQQRSARFWHNTLWDISHFCGELQKAAQNPAIDRAAQNVQKALKPKRGRFVLAEAHQGASVQSCGGVSIYLPALTEVSQFYAELEYARHHRWLPLLQAYHA